MTGALGATGARICLVANKILGASQNGGIGTPTLRERSFRLTFLGRVATHSPEEVRGKIAAHGPDLLLPLELLTGLASD